MEDATSTQMPSVGSGVGGSAQILSIAVWAPLLAALLAAAAWSTNTCSLFSSLLMLASAVPHQLQLPAQSRNSCSWLTGTVSHQAMGVSRDGDSTTSLVNLFQGLNTLLTVNKKPQTTQQTQNTSSS